MPAKSEKQRKLIFAKRGQYKTKANTPAKWKWVWGKEWEHIKEEKQPNVFDKYVEQMGGAAGGANAPMSTGSTGIANTKNYVGTMRSRKKKKAKSPTTKQNPSMV
jgi:hypothetical protein